MNFFIDFKKNGIFTTVKVTNAIPLFLELHLKRLGIENKKELVLQKIASFQKENKKASFALKIIVEHGDILFETRELPTNGVISAILYKSKKLLPVVKQIDRTIYEKAQQKAQKCNAQEAIFVNKNYILETTIANLVSEEKGQLITPTITNQGLKGITRQILLNSGQVIEKDIPISTEYPLVAVNSLRIMQIEKIDNKKLPSAKSLFVQVAEILRRAEEEYANSYNR